VLGVSPGIAEAQLESCLRVLADAVATTFLSPGGDA
jgi:hypothetical protein